jgi:hypothetical protein
MTAKRKRRTSPHSKGLAPGESLKRDKLAGNIYTAWGWVGTEVSDDSKITEEHILATCGFSRRNTIPFCANAYHSVLSEPSAQQKSRVNSLDEELDEDVIIISDDDPPPCNKKSCKNNPNCLNYLGQEGWEDEGKRHNARVIGFGVLTGSDEARRLFLRASKLGENPILEARDPSLPVGLKVCSIKRQPILSI